MFSSSGHGAGFPVFVRPGTARFLFGKLGFELVRLRWRGNKDESAKFSMGEATQRVALSCCYSRPRPYFPFPFFAYFHLPFSVICFRVCSLPITLATVFLTDWLRKIITFTLSQFSNFPDFFYWALMNRSGRSNVLAVDQSTQSTEFEREEKTLFFLNPLPFDKVFPSIRDRLLSNLDSTLMELITL